MRWENPLAQSANQLPDLLIKYHQGWKPNSEANKSTASQRTVRILRNSNVHYRVHNSPPDVFTPSNINPVQTLPHYFYNNHINITLISTPGSFKRPLSHRFPHETSLSNPLAIPHTLHASPISCSFIWSRKWCFLTCRNYITSNSHYVIFSRSLLLAPSSPTYPPHPLFSNTLSICLSLNVTYQVLHAYKQKERLQFCIS